MTPVRRLRVEADRVLRELAKLASADVTDAFADDPHTGRPAARPLRDITPATRRVIQSVKVKKRRVRVERDGVRTEIEEVEEVEFRFASKIDALDKLCKHLGITKDGDGLRELLAALAQARSGSAAAAAPGGAGDSHN